MLVIHHGFRLPASLAAHDSRFERVARIIDLDQKVEEEGCGESLDDASGH